MDTSLTIHNPGLLAGLAAGTLGGFDVMPRELLVLQCLAAGTSFRNLRKTEPSMPVGAKLDLHREGKNEHDAFAVALFFDKHKTGYLPRDKNEVIARLMDSGKRFFAKLDSKEWEGNWLKLEVSIFMKD